METKDRASETTLLAELKVFSNAIALIAERVRPSLHFSLELSLSLSLCSFSSLTPSLLIVHSYRWGLVKQSC